MNGAHSRSTEHGARSTEHGAASLSVLLPAPCSLLEDQPDHHPEKKTKDHGDHHAAGRAQIVAVLQKTLRESVGIRDGVNGETLVARFRPW